MKHYRVTLFFIRTGSAEIRASRHREVTVCTDYCEYNIDIYYPYRLYMCVSMPMRRSAPGRRP